MSRLCGIRCAARRNQCNNPSSAAIVFIASMTNWMCVVQLDAEVGRAADHVVAVDALRANPFDFIFFFTLDAVRSPMPGRPQERRRGDEAGDLVAGVQALLQRRAPRVAVARGSRRATGWR